MDIWHEMKRYQVGRTPEGHTRFSVPLKPDDEGMIGRECPNADCQPKYYKMSLTLPDEKPGEPLEMSQLDVTCPYCGMVENMQCFRTRAQAEWIDSMMNRDIVHAFDKMMRRTIESARFGPGGSPSAKLSYRAGPLPSVRHYVEEKLKCVVNCSGCSYRYAVYGMSFHCPLCGGGNLGQHLDGSAGIIRAMIDESHRVAQECGEAVGQRLVENALEDVVGLFEGFLKQIYKYGVRKRFSGDEAETKIRQIRANFQRLEGAEELFRRGFEFEVLNQCEQTDLSFLRDQFLKRHVLIHNLGLVDQKYLAKAPVLQKLGAELDIPASDVERALDLVRAILSYAIEWLEANQSLQGP